MKVAFFIGSLNRGGAETLVLDTLRKRGSAPFECLLIYRHEGNLSEDFRDTGARMIRLKTGRFHTGLIRGLRKILKREQVDILHTQTTLNAFLGLLSVCFTQKKLVATFHGFYTSFLARVFTHLTMWFADACVFVSDYERKWYLKKTLFASPERCHVIYNGIDFTKLDKPYPTPDFLEGDDLVPPRRSIRLAMVGSFVGGRSQDFLCKCLRRLYEEGARDFQFYFIGRRSDAEPERYDGCVRFCEESGLKENVHFVGGRGDVPAILRHVDGFVYSTNHDSFGIAVVEAMAVGVPVVVNDWDVMKEITDNGRTALLFETRNLESCVARIKELMQNLASYKEAASARAEEVRERFSIERHIQTLYGLYKLVIP